MGDIGKTSHKLYLILFIHLVLSFPDKYTIQDSNTNTNFDLMEALRLYNSNNKEQPISNDGDSWNGPWFPHHRHDPTPPPKIYSKENINTFMGMKSDCDDGKTNLTVDSDYSSADYTCFGKKTEPDPNIDPILNCQTIPKEYQAIHKCMSEKIGYEKDVPLYGSHRPVWPAYGEYTFLPKQRWIHSLEHGAIVMLYHPCANVIELQKLKQLVADCLWRHIITPYNLLDDERPFSLLSWGCHLSMSMVDSQIVQHFIQENALTAPEKSVFKNGDFNKNLIREAVVISDQQDSIICPKKTLM